MSDDEFLAGFEACTLARSVWTHEAHVRMAWLYLSRYSLTEAIERAQIGIRKLNAAFIAAQPPKPQRESSPQGGYHDTITVAFVRLIAARFRGDDTFETFHNLNPDLFDRTLTSLHRHYTQELLNSPEARIKFIEPDLEKLPI
jgi:hypothetical protein